MPRLPKFFQFAERNKKRKRSNSEQPAAGTSSATVGDDTGEHSAQTEILSSEREKIGLFKLSTTESSKGIDVVAVHGLQGDAFKTWTHENGTLWLRDLLPAEVPSARITTFGYDSTWAFSKSVADIGDIALDLLNRLVTQRDEDIHRRPIVFICHSLGGIVVKKALILAHERSSDPGFKDILTNTKAIAFLAVPHRGSDSAWWANFAANALKGASISLSTNNAIVADLKKNSGALMAIQKQSIERIKDVSIHTFYELLKFHGVLVVDKASAQLDLPNEKQFSVHADHRTICKIASTEDQVVVSIARLIKSMISKSVAIEDQLPSLSRSLVDLLEAKSDLTPDTTNLSLSIPIFDSLEYENWASGEDSDILWYRGTPGVGKSVAVSQVLKGLFGAPTFTEAITFFDFDTARKLGRSSANIPGAVISFITAQLYDRNPNLFSTMSRDELETIATALLRTHEIFAHESTEESESNRVIPGLVSALRTVSETKLLSCLEQSIDQGLKSMSRIYLVFDGDDNALPEDRFWFLKSVRKLFERSNVTLTGCLKILIASRDDPRAREALQGLPYFDNEKEQQDCLNSLRLGAANDRMGRIGQGEKSTGKWILCDPQYCGWRDEPGPAFLWLQGNPGTGKSTLMKQIQDQLGQEIDLVVASFYYSARGREVEVSHTHMLQALLHQILLQETEKTYPYFRSIYRIKRKQMQPWQFEELQSIFVSISVSQFDSRTFYLLLDALDESDKDRIPGVIGLLKKMTASRAKIKVLLASRPGSMISSELASSRYHLILEEKNKKDIEGVIESSIGFLRNSDEATFEWVANYIISRARGVFLWVSVVVNDIKRLTDDGWSKSEVKAKVEELPDTLVPYYQRITSLLARHGPAITDEGIKMLHWVVYSERPLTVGELRDAVAISSTKSALTPYIFSSSNLYDRRLNRLEHVPKRLMRNCGGLVEIKRPNKSAAVNSDIDHGDVVQLFHETVREFLKDPTGAAAPFQMRENSGHMEIAVVCARYIRMSLAPDWSDDEDTRSSSLTEESSLWSYENHRMFAEHLSDRPLLAYALKYLPYHIGLLDDQEQAEAILSECFNDLGSCHESHFLSSWLQSSFPEIGDLLTVDEDEAARFLESSMVAAADQGLVIAVRSLIEAETTLDVVEETTNHTALQIAAKEGHLQVVDLLIENEANVNFYGGHFGTALQAAAYCGHTKITKLLLARGADPNIESGYLLTAYMAAYCMGHTRIVNLLGAAGADPYPPPALFCNIWCASELKILIQDAIVGSSDIKPDIKRLILARAAIQYSKMGQTSSSEEMGLLALKGNEDILGDDHPETLHWCEFLARLFALHNKYEEAEAMARRALDGLPQMVGSQHSLVSQVSHTLIEILEKQGKSEEAKKVKRDFGMELENQTVE